MKQRSTLIISIVILAIFTIFLLINSSNKQRFNWSPNLKKDNKQPYGAFVVHKMLQNYFPNHSLTELTGALSENLPDHSEGGANYVFIGEGLFLDSAGTQQLLDFVGNGNTAFISSFSIPNDLMTYYLYYEECDYNYWTQYSSHRDTMVNMNFLHKNLRSKEGYNYKVIREHHTNNHSWRFIPSYYFCDEVNFVDLGYLNDSLVNFAKIPYRDGEIYLHTTPTVFGNYNLLQQNNLEYVHKMFAHLTEGDIYWDVRSKVPGRSPNINQNNNPSRHGQQASLSNETPLQFILGEDSLRWGWYLLLGLAGLYLLVRTRRRQRIIPVVEPNTNTSLEYVDTIGRLYFLQNDHRQLAHEKMKLFLGHIRERYQLNTNKIDDKFFKRLTNISQIEEIKIRSIFDQHNTIKGISHIDSNRLIDFHVAIDHFYKNSK